MIGPRPSSVHDDADRGRGGSTAAALTAALAVASFTLWAWRGTVATPFHFDDHHTVVNDLEIRDLGNCPVFLQRFFARGALKIGYAVNYAFAARLPGGEPRPEAFHAVNLAIHLLNAMLAFVLVRSLLMRGSRPLSAGISTLSAAAVAVVYAVTPLHAMAVNLIASRSETQAALFTLVALNLLVPAFDADRSRFARFAMVGLSLLSVAIAVGSKSVAVAAFPLGLLLMYYVRPCGSWGAMLRAVLAGGFVAAAILGGLIIAGEVWQFQYHGMWANLCTQAPVVLGYAWLTIAPGRVSLVHDAPLREGLDGVSLVSLLVLAGALAAGLWLARRRDWLGCGLLWYLIVIAPSSSIIPRAEVMLEYRSYLATLGLAAVLVCLVSRISSWLAVRMGAARLRLWLPATALTGWIIVLAACTVQTTRVYSDAVSLWAHAAGMAPNSFRAHHGYGRALYDAGRNDEAIDHYRRSVELEPSFVNNYWNLSAALAKRNDLAGAERELRRGLAFAPGAPNIHINLGVIRRRLGDAKGATAAFERALALDPAHPEGNYNLADILSERGESVRAVRLYETALRWKPSYPKALAGLAGERQRAEQIDEALQLARQALAIDLNEPTAHAALADAYISLGRNSQALEVLGQGLQCSPRHRLLTTRLAWFRAACRDAQFRDTAEAARLAAMLVHGSGGKDARELDLLAAVHASAGRFDAAVQTCRRALSLLEVPQDAWLIQQISIRLQLYEAGRPYVLPVLDSGSSTDTGL